MSYRKIQAALDSHLLLYQGSNVAFPGTVYAPAHGIPFLQVNFTPAPAKGIALGAGAPELHSGQYRITVHDPDMANALSRADSLRTHFAKGSTLSFEGLDVHLDGAALGPDEGKLKHVSLPLAITWRSYF
jgi:hypothetical protein